MREIAVKHDEMPDLVRVFRLKEIAERRQEKQSLPATAMPAVIPRTSGRISDGTFRIFSGRHQLDDQISLVMLSAFGVGGVDALPLGNTTYREPMDLTKPAQNSHCEVYEIAPRNRTIPVREFRRASDRSGVFLAPAFLCR